MSETSNIAVSHFGICCSNLDNSINFYTEALGFTLDRAYDNLGSPYDAMSELPGIQLSARFLKCGEVTIELLGYPDSAVIGPKHRRPMNQLGITHLSLIVNDIDAVVQRIESFGGQVVTGTKVQSPFGPMLFCTDPDGIRIELMARGG